MTLRSITFRYHNVESSSFFYSFNAYIWNLLSWCENKIILWLSSLGAKWNTFHDFFFSHPFSLSLSLSSFSCIWTDSIHKIASDNFDRKCFITLGTHRFGFHSFLCFWFCLKKQMYYFDLFHVAVIQLLLICLFICFVSFTLLDIYFDQKKFELNAIMMYIMIESKYKK